jgi:chitinase
MVRAVVLSWSMVLLAACAGGETGATPDAGLATDAGGAEDAGGTDAGEAADAGETPSDAGTPSVRPLWVTAYYASWMEAELPVAEVDFGAITHLAHFGWLPRESDGAMDVQWGTTPEQSRRVVAATHAAGRRALLVVGGAWTRAGFLEAMAPERVDAFVGEIVAGVTTYGYDGVDLDMEPLEDEDAALYGAFVRKLRAALDGVRPGLALTAAVGWNGTVLAPLVAVFDQVNLMTYDLAGAWPGWETWHNTPLHDGGLKFRSQPRKPLPSVEGLVDAALATGAVREKLGIGLSFYVYVWKGATGPNQPLAGVEVEMNKSYAWMMDRWLTPRPDPAASPERWHDGVEAPYLSITWEANPKFVSYESERSAAAKIAWARAQGLGGVIVWELGGGYRKSQPPGLRDPLLQAVKAAAFPP